MTHGPRRRSTDRLLARAHVEMREALPSPLRPAHTLSVDNWTPPFVPELSTGPPWNQAVSQLGTCHCHQPLGAASQELDRLALKLALPALIGFEDRPGTGAERPVVEEDHPGIEQEMGTKGFRHGVGAISVDRHPGPRIGPRFRREERLQTR